MRPQFHFTAPSGWINDPHGITFRDGQYHLFYQYVPDSLKWAPNCHWGHALSPDLFTFEHLPVAIAPGDGDDGIWSGSLVTDDSGSARIFYTSVTEPDIGSGRVRVATPVDEDWVEWKKGSVVAGVPAGLHTVAFRDPFVFRDGSHWRMFVGAALEDGSAAAASYKSEDLSTWEYEGIAASRSTSLVDPVWTGRLWECPQVFEIGGRHALVTSVWDADTLHYVAYALGDYLDGKFTADTWGRLSYGDSYYAPSFFRDQDGVACLTFWLRGVGDHADGWESAHSVPHTVTLRDGRLEAAPHAELSKYRGREVNAGEIVGPAVDCDWHSGGQFVVYAEGECAASVHVGEPDALTLHIGEDSWTMPHDSAKVRIVVDGPTIEISTSQGVLAAPISPKSNALSFSFDGVATIFELVR